MSSHNQQRSMRMPPYDTEVESSTSSNTNMSEMSTVEVVVQEDPPINNFQAAMHLIKTAVGTGVLAMPFIVHKAGILMGPVGIFVVSLLVVHTCNILVYATQYVRRYRYPLAPSTYLDYASVVRESVKLGPSWLVKHTWIAMVPQFCIVAGQFGFLSVCTVFVSENAKTVLGYYWPAGKDIDIGWYKLVVYILLLGVVAVKSLDRMTIFSGLANLMGITSLGIALVYSLTDLKPAINYPLVKDVTFIPIMFSMVLYAFEVITVVVPLENKMKDKSALPGVNGVLSVSLVVATAVYVALGFYGYLCFGDDVGEAIIYSMPMDPWYLMLTKPLYVLAVLFSYAIQFYVLMQILWKAVTPCLRGRSRVQLLLIDGFLRLFLVTSASILGVVIPTIGLLISLIGAGACSLLTFVFPAMAHALTVRHSHAGQPYSLKTKLILAKNAVLVVIGIVGLFLGMFISISDLINHFTQSS